jgi:hypothetical protein
MHSEATLSGVFAEPRLVTDLDDCDFYHTIDLPGYGLVQGQWDLRAGIRSYLGGVDFKGKRVLEVGTASGFVCFWLESQGAEVVAYDLSDEHDWDMVPFAGLNQPAMIAGRRDLIRRQNNAYWLGHRVLNSKARVVYGTVYDIPEEIGPVDITTFGSMLLHVRDPFLALQRAAAITEEAIIVTDRVQPSRRWVPINLSRGPVLRFLPNPKSEQPNETWWWFPPETIVRFLAVLGFSKSTVTTHSQDSKWGKQRLFTVVGRR